MADPRNRTGRSTVLVSPARRSGCPPPASGPWNPEDRTLTVRRLLPLEGYLARTPPSRLSFFDRVVRDDLPATARARLRYPVTDDARPYEGVVTDASAEPDRSVGIVSPYDVRRGGVPIRSIGQCRDRGRAGQGVRAIDLEPARRSGTGRYRVPRRGGRSGGMVPPAALSSRSGRIPACPDCGRKPWCHASLANSQQSAASR